MNTLNLKIDGMHCGGCAERLHSLLVKEDGVEEATLSADENSGKVVFGPSATSEENIIGIIERAGFTAQRA
ncbi:MAG: heavy-metal-associated domain-containing protein [Rhizobiaceae bacterium]|nr:heavy-metal-associated domain-containing protein [Rhizobiaceae bacterium]